VGEETDSLCMSNSDKLFNVMFVNSSDYPKHGGKLFLVCSDGYEKAFESNHGFEKSALDFANLVANENGRKTIELELEQWLSEYSSFSGDDVSLGILYEKSIDVDLAEANKSDVLLEEDQAHAEPIVEHDETFSVNVINKDAGEDR
jgi:hypothetical protein